MNRTLLLALLMAATMAATMNETAIAETGSTAAPPAAPKKPKVDVIHGDKRVDDYFWMRDKKNPEVIAYLEAENAHTAAAMKATEAFQERLYKEILGRIKETDLSVPYKQAGYWYYSRTEEGKQYPIYCRKKGSLEAPEQVTLDLNELARGQKFMSLGSYAVSDDGRLLAYSTDNTGFRQYTLYVKDLESGRILPEKIEKAVSLAWTADNKTLFYTVEDHAKRSYRMYRHALSTPVNSDPLIYEEKDERFRISVRRSRSKAYLFLGSGSHTASEVRYLAADRPEGEWKVVAEREPEHEYGVDHHGEQFFIRTNQGARNFRLVSAPVRDPQKKNWKEIVPHRPEVMLEGMSFFAGHYVLTEREGGLPQLRITDMRSGQSHRVTFPEPVYAAGQAVNPEFDTRVFRFTYQSFVTPTSVYDYDMDARERKLLKRTDVLGDYDPERYQSERIYATAADGVRVPISLVYRKGLKRDGRTALLLTAYGSYGNSIPVAFNHARISLLDRGVIYALAHIRGGGDLGKAWHDQGRMFSKKNTFSDFVASADHLVSRKYTSSGRLVIQGGSAGGLLMGAAINMRPDLFKAVVSNVPFVDVINTMLDTSLPLTVGEFEEWGNPQKKEEYEYMKTYCPYTNLAKKSYPAMLVKTSLNDSQVMYWEPAKYVAKMRTLKTDKNPLLFKTNMAAGHGGASGRYDFLREVAFDYAFILGQLGITK